MSISEPPNTPDGDKLKQLRLKMDVFVLLYSAFSYAGTRSPRISGEAISMSLLIPELMPFFSQEMEGHAWLANAKSVT